MQRHEQRAVPARQVTPCGVADGAEAAGEQRRGARRLVHRGGVCLGVGREHRPERQAEAQPHAEEEPDRQLLAAASSRVLEPEQAGEGDEEEEDSRAARLVASEVGAERHATEGEGHEAHHLTEDAARLVLSERLVAERCLTSEGHAAQDR